MSKKCHPSLDMVIISHMSFACNLGSCACNICLQSCSLGYTYTALNKKWFVLSGLTFHCTLQTVSPCKCTLFGLVNMCLYGIFTPCWRVVKSKSNRQNNSGWRLNEKGVRYPVLFISGGEVRVPRAVLSDCTELNWHGQWAHTINGQTKQDQWDCIYNLS